MYLCIELYLPTVLRYIGVLRYICTFYIKNYGWEYIYTRAEDIYL